MHFCPRLRFSYILNPFSEFMVDSSFVTPGWDNIKLSEPNPKKLITTFRYTVISPSLELAEQMFLDCPLFLSALPHNGPPSICPWRVSKPVQCHSVLVRYWFQMWKKTVVSSCYSGHSSILILQCIVLTNKWTELAIPVAQLVRSLVWSAGNTHAE